VCGHGESPELNNPGYGQRPRFLGIPERIPHENPKNPPPPKIPHHIYIYIKRVYGLGDLGGLKRGSLERESSQIPRGF